MELNELQQKVDGWITTTGVRYFNELTNLGILMEEVGELARLMVRQYGEQSFKETDKKNAETKDAMADEMADILWVLTALANQCHINLDQAMQQNLEKKNKRDEDRHRQNEKLH